MYYNKVCFVDLKNMLFYGILLLLYAIFRLTAFKKMSYLENYCISYM